MREAFSIMLELGGLAALCFGLWLAWPPLAPIVAGLGMIVLAQGFSRGRT